MSAVVSSRSSNSNSCQLSSSQLDSRQSTWPANATTTATNKTAIFEPKDSHEDPQTNNNNFEQRASSHLHAPSLLSASSPRFPNGNATNNKLLPNHHHNHRRTYPLLKETLPVTSSVVKSMTSSSVVKSSSRYPTHGLSNNVTHSYYDCCINVHVSSLLDHWLDWEPSKTKAGDRCCVNKTKCYFSNEPSTVGSDSDMSTSESSSDSSSSSSDEEDFLQPLSPGYHRNNKHQVPPPSSLSSDTILSHLCNSADPLSRLRQFSTSLGCDINKQIDSDGKSLLHHVLAGKIRSQISECVQLLIDLKADVNLKDVGGETPLLSARHLLDQGLYDDAYRAVTVLLASDVTVDVNARDLKTDQSLLSWAVRHGDQTVELTRHLLNSGANVWNKSTSGGVVDDSAFKSLLKALMTQRTTLEASGSTVDMLCAVMSADPERMVRHVDRCMIQMGVAPKVNGPLFLRLRAKMAPHMIRPQSLMSMSRTRIRAALLRKSQGLKRLQPQRTTQQLPASVTGVTDAAAADGTKHKPSSVTTSITANRVCQLKLPQKLSRYICLGENPSDLRP